MSFTEATILELVYGATAANGAPPRASELAAVTSSTRDAVLDVFRRLNARRMLALSPESGEIVMAPPFSAVPTPFQVLSQDRVYFANCAWDALGVPAALEQDAVVRASCACCGDPIELRIESGRPLPEPCVAHFAVPAEHWWDDIIYT